MTLAATSVRDPFFIDHKDRRLFAIYHPAASGSGNGSNTQGGVVFFAPFAEELNRTRKMATLLAEALSPHGIATLVFDYSCTGDSTGRFEQADWAHWIDDGAAAIAWLAAKIDKPVTPIGLRLGAALALLSAAKEPQPIRGTVLWQPVTNGSVMLNQFLRIRIAAALSSGEDGETTKDLRARLSAGETLEVAGYDLNPALVRGIDAVSLGQIPPSFGTAHDWFEVSTEDEGDLTPASQAVVEKWRGAKATVSAQTVQGEPFWSTQEMATAPALIKATVDAVTGGNP
ncbi:MAG: hydrolase 2, exosortase A system-associated [Rhodospirillaceae bacterium]|nr:hydrolase 2, exosortase A system-associated [Rhodospirillaceae bacterium]MBT5458932.1 hydrolase 2, exosortase A system-associated [Rhodospirillaceae bacterium]